MHTKRKRFIDAIIFALVWMALAGPGVSSGAELPADGWRPPAFEATTQDGDTFAYPADLKGPAIVLFWATWCPYCKALMPHLQSIRDEYRGEIQVLAVNFNEDGDPQAYLDSQGFEFTLFADADAVAESWGVQATPGLFLADAEGRVVFSRGAIPKEAYATTRFKDEAELKHSQKAARRAPLWAARLREALDGLRD